MPSQDEINNEKDEYKFKFAGFCRVNFTNSVDEKNLQIFDCSFEKGKIVFYLKLVLLKNNYLI